MMMANDEEQQLVCRVFWNVCCCFVCRRLVFYGCVNLCRVSLSSLSMGRCVAGSRSGMLLWAEKLFVFFVTDVNVGGFISPRLHDGGCLFLQTVRRNSSVQSCGWTRRNEFSHGWMVVMQFCESFAASHSHHQPSTLLFHGHDESLFVLNFQQPPNSSFRPFFSIFPLPNFSQSFEQQHQQQLS